MTSNILRSSFEGREVRMVETDGQPWWIAADVCGVLDLKQPHRSIAGLDDDEKGRHNMTTLGGPQEVITINEAGLYSLILRSRKPEAKRFKRWVTHEVLPTIRTKGLYIASDENPMYAGAMQMVEQVNTIAREVADIRECMHEARMLAKDLPEPLMGVLPHLTRSGEISKAARYYCILTATKPGGLWPRVYAAIEFHYGIRITTRKKRAGFKGSTLKFAIEQGYGDMIYTTLHSLIQRELQPPLMMA